jgi:hypothetical protein
MFYPPASFSSELAFDGAKIATWRSRVKQIADVFDEFRFANDPVIDTTQASLEEKYERTYRLYSHS